MFLLFNFLLLVFRNTGKLFLLIIFLFGGKLLCSVVLASAVQQCESVIIIHVSPPSVPPLQVITESQVRLPVL